MLVIKPLRYYDITILPNYIIENHYQIQLNSLRNGFRLIKASKYTTSRLQLIGKTLQKTIKLAELFGKLFLT